MLKTYSVIYCIVLALFLLLMLVAKFLVGAGGHNPPAGISDYIVIIYCIATPICLITHLNRPSRVVRYINMVLVATAAASTLYITAEMVIRDEFVFIMFACCLLFVLLCLALLRALYKN